MTVQMTEAHLHLAFEKTQRELVQIGKDYGVAKPAADFTCTPPPELHGHYVVKGFRPSMDRFAINAAVLLAGDALSAGSGFPHVIDTDDLLDILPNIQDSIHEVSGTMMHALSVKVP